MTDIKNDTTTNNCREAQAVQKFALIDLSLRLKKSSYSKYRMNSEFLLAFLRYSHFDVDESKKRLDNFYSHKQMFPEVLMNRTLDESLLRLYRQGIHVIPENPISCHGPRLIITQYSKITTEEHNPMEIIKLLFILGEILANEDPKASVNGIIYIVDARNMTEEIMKHYNEHLLKLTWKFVEQCLPLRVKEMHIINMRKEGEDIFDFVKSFVSRKMEMKFMIHKKAEDLYKYLPRESMTVEYGGHNGYQTLAVKHWEKVMLSKYKEYFANEEDYGINEKLKIGATNPSNLEVSLLTGLNGSFRKLTID